MKTLYKDRTNYQGSLLALIFSPFYAMDKPQKKLSDGQITLFLQWFQTFLEALLQSFFCLWFQFGFFLKSSLILVTLALTA